MACRVLLVDVSPTVREQIARDAPGVILSAVNAFDPSKVDADVVVCSWERHGHACCEALREHGLRLPLIALVQARDEACIVDAMRAGAADVVVCDRLERLAPILEREHGVPQRLPRRGEAPINELRFRSMWDSDIILVTVVGADGRIVDANDAFAKALGWSREELRDMSWATLTPPEWADIEHIARAQLLNEGAARPWEKEVVAKDGRRVPLLASAVLMPGKPLQALAFALDLSERKRVDRALHERVRIATATAEVAVALTEAPNLEVMLQRSCDALQRTFQLRAVELWTVEHGELQLRATAGATSHAGGAALSMTTAAQGLARADWPLRWEPFLKPSDGFERCPLTIGSELIGMLRLQCDQPLDAVAQEAIATMASATALGVQRARAEARKDLAEAELRQAQKLEAIGRLAGGVAHDFNNLLSVIIGYAKLTREQLDPDDAITSDIAEIEAAGERAKVLTAQLLAFGRRQVLQPRVLDLDSAIIDLRSMLQRLLSEAIELSIVRDDGPHRVFADPHQVEQVLMNLVVNARDAINGAGCVTIATSAVLDDDGRRCVKLVVSDTGLGMEPAVRARIFEPFFTTKPQGEGTGLGLSMVFGIVKQSGGAISVESEPGRGSRFELLFPSVDAPVQLPQLPPKAALVGGAETILLCEDDRQVRALCRDTLERFGYRVLEAPTVADAIVLAAAPIDLLLSDVVMPVMSGRQLSERIRAMHPVLPVLFMSGYNDDRILHHGVSHEGVPFLQKPISPDSLIVKVREVLDAAASKALLATQAI